MATTVTTGVGVAKWYSHMFHIMTASLRNVILLPIMDLNLYFLSCFYKILHDQYDIIHHHILYTAQHLSKV